MQILHMCLKSGRQSHAISTYVAATRMQIFPIFNAHGCYLASICMRLAAKRLIYLACIAASRMQNLDALAAIALQSRQFFCHDAGSMDIEIKKRQIFKNLKYPLIYLYVSFEYCRFCHPSAVSVGLWMNWLSDFCYLF